MQGIGLVLFNNKDPQDPNFQIRVRPQKHDPDMFYVNKYMKYVEGEMYLSGSDRPWWKWDGRR